MTCVFPPELGRAAGTMYCCSPVCQRSAEGQVERTKRTSNDVLAREEVLRSLRTDLDVDAMQQPPSDAIHAEVRAKLSRTPS